MGAVGAPLQVSHEDLERFKAGDDVVPGWFDQNAANIVTSQFQVQPGLIRLLSKDPITQLLELMMNPDVGAWDKFSKWMPYLFVRGSHRAKSQVELAAEAAISVLDQSAPFPKAGTDVCWAYANSGIAITAGARSTTEPPRAVLAVDDRDDRLELLDGQAWKEWLRLSNWLGISEHHRVGTHSTLSAAPVLAAEFVREDSLPGEWQKVYDEAVTDGERELIRALADVGAAVPELGYETDNGGVLDMAWAGARVGVIFGGEADAVGWTLCAPDAGEILAALKANGAV